MLNIRISRPLPVMKFSEVPNLSVGFTSNKEIQFTKDIVGNITLVFNNIQIQNLNDIEFEVHTFMTRSEFDRRVNDWKKT